MRISRELNAVLTIAYRDLMKFLKDKTRLVFSFIFPVIFIGILGTSLQSSVGEALPYSFIAFTFTGILAQTLFQSTASGIISIIQDRENDFAQELFVSPVSRYSIVLGKIIGESLVSMVQGIGIVLFGFILGVSLSLSQLLAFIPLAVVATLLGGAFGVLVLSNMKDQRTANQIFPFLIFPQYFLAGIFSPINNLPPFLKLLSRISPMTYIVDLFRNSYFNGKEYVGMVTVFSFERDLLVISFMFLLFLILGTTLFSRNEINR